MPQEQNCFLLHGETHPGCALHHRLSGSQTLDIYHENAYFKTGKFYVNRQSKELANLFNSCVVSEHDLNNIIANRLNCVVSKQHLSIVSQNTFIRYSWKIHKHGMMAGELKPSHFKGAASFFLILESAHVCSVYITTIYDTFANLSGNKIQSLLLSD